MTRKATRSTTIYHAMVRTSKTNMPLKRFSQDLLCVFIFRSQILKLILPTTTMASHDEKFIPERKKLDQLSVVKDYSAIPRLEYR